MLNPRAVSACAALALSLVSFTLSGSAIAGDPEDEQFVDHDPSVVPPQGTGSTLFVVGAAVTAGWYGAALGTSYLWSSSAGSKDLRIPVVGPVLALGKTGCAKNEADCGTFTVVLRTVLTAFSAVGQVGGLAAMAEALFLPSPKSRAAAGTASGAYRSLPARVDLRKSAALTLTPVPLITDDGALGLGLHAQF